MKKIALIMDMPVAVEIADQTNNSEDIEEVFTYLRYMEEVFSTYNETSEIERINRGEITPENYSPEMKNILNLCEKTKQETNGYFDIAINGKIDPSGLVKGYAINEAAKILAGKGYHNYYVDIGGDVQAVGKNNENRSWAIGIRNPFNQDEIVKVVFVSDRGVATSGTYIRGNHIYNPIRKIPATEIVSLTVVGFDIYEADRFVTPAFAMGLEGINWLEQHPGLEGYLITHDRRAIFTSGFSKYLTQ